MKTTSSFICNARSERYDEEILAVNNTPLMVSDSQTGGKQPLQFKQQQQQRRQPMTYGKLDSAFARFLKTLPAFRNLSWLQ